MVQWFTYADENVSLRVPKGLKPSRSKYWQKLSPALLFKGRIRRPDSNSALMVGIDVDANPETVKATMEAAQTNPATESMGTRWQYHYIGPSLTRPGGFEVKITQINPSPHGEAQRWGIIFSLGRRWIYVDIMSATGGLNWDEFALIDAEIITSIELTGPSSSTTPRAG